MCEVIIRGAFSWSFWSAVFPSWQGFVSTLNHLSLATHVRWLYGKSGGSWCTYLILLNGSLGGVSAVDSGSLLQRAVSIRLVHVGVPGLPPDWAPRTLVRSICQVHQVQVKITITNLSKNLIPQPTWHL